MLRFISSIFLLILCWTRVSADPLQREVYLMGTTFRILYYESDRKKALEETEQIIRIVEQTENQISNWRPDTELSKFNRHPVGDPFPLSLDFCNLLRELQKWAEKTNGAFDPSVGALIKIWGIQGEARIPAVAEVASTLQYTGMRHIKIDTTCKAIKSSAVVLDAGAFGKGYAIDRILTYANDNRTAPFIIDFGGQIAVYGSLPDASLGEILISDPNEREIASKIVVRIHNGSLSTSGGSERDQVVNGRRVGHILDPRTGFPAAVSGSVTVWHPSAMAADILSTALYVMGPNDGLKWANQNHIAACFIKGAKVSKSLTFSDLDN